MVAIQIISDLHLEDDQDYECFKIEPRAKYLALLGDIGNLGRQQDKCLHFLRDQLRQFRIVFFVPGSQEAFGSSWEGVIEILEAFEEQTRRDGSLYGEFVLLNQREFQIPKTNTFILGCSLFPSTRSGSDGHPREAQHDYFSKIKYWNTSDHHKAHVRDREWLNETVATLSAESGRDPGFRIAIFTHWSPSMDERAIEPLFEGDSHKCGLSTDLSREECYLNSGVVLWAFGNTHYNCDFLAARRPDGLGIAAPIRILTNQRGYGFEPAVGFDRDKTVEI